MPEVVEGPAGGGGGGGGGGGNAEDSPAEEKEVSVPLFHLPCMLLLLGPGQSGISGD